MSEPTTSASAWPEFAIDEGERPAGGGPHDLVDAIAALIRTHVADREAAADERRQDASRRRELLLRLLESTDALDRLLASTDPAALGDGLRIAAEQLLATLEDCEDVVPQEVAPGGRFDPRHHRAIGTRPAAGTPDGTILAVNQRGYWWRDALLRKAHVTVARGETKEQ